jgi:hypothetical protein
MKSYKAAPHAAWRRVEDEIVILDLNTSLYYSLNEVGARVWELLNEGHSREDVARSIVEEYDADHKAAAKDIDSLIKELSQEKLLVAG